MIRKVIITILILLVLGSAGYLFVYFSDTEKGKEEYRDLQSGMVAAEIGEAPEGVPSGTVKIGKELPRYTPVTAAVPAVDEKTLKEMNADYRAWLYIPDTDISYPVVWSREPGKYLKTSFEGERRSCGCLFFSEDYEPFTAFVTIINGHNMKSGEMFGTLDRWNDKEYARTHRTLYLYADGIWREYRLFSVYDPGKDDAESYAYAFSDEKDFADWVEKRREKSVVEFDAEEAARHDILTLSTCNGNSLMTVLHYERIR